MIGLEDKRRMDSLFQAGFDKDWFSFPGRSGGGGRSDLKYQNGKILGWRLGAAARGEILGEARWIIIRTALLWWTYFLFIYGSIDGPRNFMLSRVFQWLGQCCGSGFIESGSGILHFKWIRIQIQSFDEKKIGKNTAEIFLKSFFDKQLQLT